jgi:hypothetical protein
LPNLRIIDFSYGNTGSTHDSTAWTHTRLAKEHCDLMEPGEWVWADSAYPVDVWIVSPYKKPERDHPDNEEFNKHVSRVRIRSEHAIGFLKGRFHSLKNLRLKIRDKKSHILATYWVAACIAVHSFAMQCEEYERHLDRSDSDHSSPEDPFIAKGLSSASDSDITTIFTPQRINSRTTRLQAGKAHRENLKAKLFHSKARRVQRNIRIRAEGCGVHVSADSDSDIE